MAELTSLELADSLLASLRALWVAHADFTARGTVIESPRVMHYPDNHVATELVALSIPGITVGDQIRESPPLWKNVAPLMVGALIDIDATASGNLGDAAAEVLVALQPLAVIVQKRIEIDLRLLQTPSTETALSCQFYDWSFESYAAEVDKEGNRLRALGSFTYQVEFAVPQFFDGSTLDDLDGADVDHKLYGGIGDTLFPDSPHAQDDETLP